MIEDNYKCPKCGGELAGDGENGLDCMECDFHCHEVDIEKMKVI